MKYHPTCVVVRRQYTTNETRIVCPLGITTDIDNFQMKLSGCMRIQLTYIIHPKSSVCKHVLTSGNLFLSNKSVISKVTGHDKIFCFISPNF